MKLFLPNGFKLNPSSPTYRDHVLHKSEPSAPKQLQNYHHEGKLDALITEFRASVATETILDPAPSETQDPFVRA
ncbi:hypothetical protein PHMEG_00035141 [Phytophthora megakarya]|uniref:Uncharacterized protein n=1 Tax=Phytophthora megakarya TaxID=4795 RepID=A0A225UPE9_9STRA|nr:hypothetical protein PHMEG_00035141 [Phytophthora megakarya]